MTTMLATMADALIDFILSLLQDPAVQEEFDADPEGTLAARGMQNVSHADVCAVLPVVYDNPHVVQRAVVDTPSTHGTDPVGVLRNVLTTNSYITNNSTLVDQSVNQNIWAQGDVMQIFDNEAVLATGAGSTAAGNDIIHDSSQDSSTTIVAGGDAVVDNDIDVSTVDGSYNTATDATTTDNSVDVSLTDVQITPAPEPEPAPAVMDATESASDDAPADAGLLPEPEPIDESFDADEY